ncbi:DoxX family protein [Mucilaginibacter endophyticus]|uniref:DoxX family protein n=1 Tax=Mucilaginibacter endophyticus TaxID=2675003 RepID=UPI000E0DAA35|nr:DoxX family protein [Mucilaginibacter endophyticus]
MKTLIEKITATDVGSAVPLVLRIAFFIVMFPHGAQLFTGWFQGSGYTGSMNYFSSLGLPPLIGFLVIFLEFFGSVFILAGLFTRLFAFACICLVMGMILMVHIHIGFFMNWYGLLKGEGFEYHILMLSMLVSLLVAGSGKAGIDTLFTNKNK